MQKREGSEHNNKWLKRLHHKRLDSWLSKCWRLQKRFSQLNLYNKNSNNANNVIVKTDGDTDFSMINANKK